MTLIRIGICSRPIFEERRWVMGDRYLEKMNTKIKGLAFVV